MGIFLLNRSAEQDFGILLNIRYKIPKDELEKISEILEKNCSDFFNKYDPEKGNKPLSDREIMLRTFSLLLYWDNLTDALEGMDKNRMVDVSGEGIDPLKLERLSNKYKLLTLKKISGGWKYVLEPSYDFERNFRFLIQESVKQYPNDLYLRAARKLL
ncbi:MAG: hypothetical protein QMD36_06040 [Candidatus Aenigmarchaeota archaeon]|nr:hypothetical protein [Candidatus Aenigmarchaeota archaeon]